MALIFQPKEAARRPDPSSVGGILKQIHDRHNEIMAKHIEGRILFNPPDTMVQGGTVAVTIRIAGNKDVKVEDNLDTDTKPTIEKIEVKPYMTVRLIGRDDGAFHVSSETAENQMVPDDGFAEWRFTVQAIEFRRSHTRLRSWRSCKKYPDQRMS